MKKTNPANDFVKLDPFEIAAKKKAEREAAQSPAPAKALTVAENPEIQISGKEEIQNPVIPEIRESRKEDFQISRFPENPTYQKEEIQKSSIQENQHSGKPEKKKSRNPEIQKSVTRNYKLSLNLQPKYEKKLKRLALNYDLFMAEVLELAIDNLEIQKSGILGRLHDKERTRVNDDFDLDDDLELDKNHHHAVVQFYQNLTAKRWTDADDKFYREVQGIELAQIKTAMRKIQERASEPIGTFKYFAVGIKKELENLAPEIPAPSFADRVQHWIDEFNAEHSNAWQIPHAQKLAYLQKRCADENLIWNEDEANDLF